MTKARYTAEIEPSPVFTALYVVSVFIDGVHCQSWEVDSLEIALAVAQNWINNYAH